MPATQRAAWPRLGRWLGLVLLVAVPAGGIGGLMNWLTGPSARRPTPPTLPHPPTPSELPSIGSPTNAVGVDLETPPRRVDFVSEWPRTPDDGARAKALLLEFMRDCKRRIDQVASYTANLKRRERIGGKLGVEQNLLLKVRRRPFSVYLRFLAPKAGKEALFVEGERGGKVLAHNGDWTRRLMPLLEVAPSSPIAMVDNRHPITEAGLANLIDRLLYFRELDLTDPKGTLTLDRTRDESGKEWLRSVTVMPYDDGVRPFARVEVLYCPELRLPLRIENFGWPEPGSESSEFPLVESYRYEGLDLEAGLSASDFDPRNGDYQFHSR